MRVIIPAAGRGTRLKEGEAGLPKVMHLAGGRPLLETVLSQTNFIAPEDTYIVVGYKKEDIMSYFGDRYHYVVQEEPLGTGHAVMVCADAFKGYEGTVLVTFGDMPLFRREVTRGMCETLEEENADCILLTAESEAFPHWARIVREADGTFRAIVEAKDCTTEEQQITELFAGVLAFRSEALFEVLPRITRNNAQHEYYLTEAPAILAADGRKVITYVDDDPDDLRGVNTAEELVECERVLKEREDRDARR